MEINPNKNKIIEKPRVLQNKKNKKKRGINIQELLFKERDQLQHPWHPEEHIRLVFQNLGPL